MDMFKRVFYGVGRNMKRVSLSFSSLVSVVVVLVVASPMLSVGQVTIYSQDFETNLSGYSHTPSQTPASDPGDQYFHRAEPSDGDIYESGGPYTNVTNSWLFVGSNPNTINSSTPGILDLGTVSVSGYTDLFFSADFGGVPNDWDASDEVEVEYQFDSNGWNTLYSFTSPVTNDPLELENNATGSINTANGTVLTYALQTITSDNFTGSGSNLSLRIVCNANANYEAFGVDNVLLKGTAASSESITTSAITGSPFCVGNGVTAAVSVPYTISGTFAGTNDFAAQLSDASGSFASPTTIGTLSNTSSAGTISATIPASITAGTGYRIRVVGNDPATTGSDNGSDLTIENFTAPTGLSVSCGNGEASASWTNPACFDEVMLVAKATTAFTATLPTGNGSSYTANLAFGSGTTFDGGSVVYKGAGTASGTITALSNGTAYNFKIFGRHGTNWVAASVESCTPSAITECLNDDFNVDYGNWTGGSGTYQNTGAGLSGNGTGFNGTGDDIITTSAITNPLEIVFWLARSSSTSNRTLSVEYSTSSSGPWTSAQDILVGSVTTTHQEFTVPLNLSGNYYLRFNISQHSGGSYYLDDVVVNCGSTPSITVSTNTLSGFTYVVGSGPSAVQSFTVEGADLTADITVTAPTNYEISTSNSPFSASSPITLTQTGGTVSTTTIYVRLASGLSVGAYNSQDIVCASTGATSENVACSGDVTSLQTITTGTVTGPFCVGNGATEAVSVPYTITGTFAATNDFTAELSNASGSFASPTTIGTLSNTNANGTVSATIPASITAGTGYRIRVVGNDPATNGSDNGTDLTIENFAAPTAFAVSCGNTEASASWTNPDCFDEVMVVANSGSYTATLPTGDGTAYTANLAFGAGTTFDGGSVVYKGTATSTGTITGLTNGTLYSFKVFARKGTTWVAGSVLSCTPVSQCGDESFTSLDAPGGTYGAGSYTGDNGVTWTYAEARTVTTTHNITGTSIGFADSGTRNVTATSTSNGVGDITFSMRSYFTGGNASDRTIQVYVNGTLYGTYTLAAMSTVYTHTVTANEPGTVSIEFRSTGSRQVVIDDISWTCAGTLPTITVSPSTLTGFTYQFGSGPSAVQSFTVEGTDLTNDISISLPTNYEISTSNSPFSAASSSITLTQTGGTVSSTTIYVVLQSGLSVGTYNGETLNCTSTGATTRTVTFDGEVTSVPTSVTTGAVSTSPFNLTSCSDAETGTVAFTSTGTFNGGNVYSVELSDASGDFGSAVTIGTLSSTANSGNINITIPAGISAGTGYKVRVVSSDPSFTGTESGNLTITTSCTATYLESGDLAILAFNTNVDGSFGYDEISFVSFVDINPGTVIDFTDNAYEKCGTTGGWGVSEGWFRMVRTSSTLAAGEVVTVKVEYGNAVAVAPDANWSISKPQPTGQGNFDLNADGEQVFILSGGTVGGPSSASPTSDAGTYTGGEILYGFNTKGDIWTPVCGNAAAGGTKNSAKPIEFDCFLVWPTSQADKNKYTGPLTAASQREWLYRINTSSNWSGYANNTNYEAGTDFKDFNGPSAGRTLSINANGFTPGLWTGDDDTDWNNCRNWQSLRVPDTDTDVLIPPTINDPHVLTGNTAICKTVHIQTDAGAKLYIDGTGIIQITLP